MQFDPAALAAAAAKNPKIKASGMSSHLVTCRRNTCRTKSLCRRRGLQKNGASSSFWRVQATPPCKQWVYSVGNRLGGLQVNMLSSLSGQMQQTMALWQSMGYVN